VSISESDKIETENLSVEKDCNEQRNLRGKVKGLIGLIAIIFALFHLYTGATGPIYVMFQRSVHLGFALILTFSLYPISKNKKEDQIQFLDLLLIALSVGSTLYSVIGFEGMVERQGIPNAFDQVFSAITILLVLEAARRVMGIQITIIVSAFLLYAIAGQYLPGLMAHRPFSLSRILGYQYMTTEGLFGIPLGVSATFVVLFILFGAFMHKTGMGQFFLDMAMAAAGHLAGGPAKVSVLSSGMMGMISGSAVANVVTTGSFTIPLMKRIGYGRNFAAGVETVSSVGGLFMPPIMGAAGFVMAEFLGISYLSVAAMAFAPACLYYFAVLCQVHFRAKKLNLQGLPKSELPNPVYILKTRGYLLIPIIVLIYFLLKDYSPMRVGFYAIVATLALGFLANYFKGGQERFTITKFFEACEEGAKTAVVVAVACTAAGIIVGVVTMTGLGLKFAMLIYDISQGILLITLLMTMIVCLVLGMGVPVTASYIIVATIAAPALIKLGVYPAAAHLFVLYFAVLADITPPVCIAAFAAAGVAKSNPMQTGFSAWKLGLAGFIIPFLFCYNSALLGIGDFWEIATVVLTGLIGLIALSGAIEKYFIGPLKIYHVFILLTASVLLILPGTISDIIGFSLILFLFGWKKYLHFRNDKSLTMKA